MEVSFLTTLTSITTFFFLFYNINAMQVMLSIIRQLIKSPFGAFRAYVFSLSLVMFTLALCFITFVWWRPYLEWSCGEVRSRCGFVCRNDADDWRCLMLCLRCGRYRRMDCSGDWADGVVACRLRAVLHPKETQRYWPSVVSEQRQNDDYFGEFSFFATNASLSVLLQEASFLSKGEPRRHEFPPIFFTTHATTSNSTNDVVYLLFP